MSDRTYFQSRPPLAWHALNADASDPGDWSFVGLCSRTTTEELTTTCDRVPSDGHLCGSCGRSIAAQTDVEDIFAADREPVVKPDASAVTGRPAG